MKKTIAFLVLCMFFNFTGNAQTNKKQQKKDKIEKTSEAWKELLSNEQYNVLRLAGTETPFSSPLNKNYDVGVYQCSACETPLYESKFKFDSGTGWPSFDRAITKNVALDVDYKIGYARTELKCNTCGGHLGHSFNDGPTPTGKRHCINGVALKFIPKKD